MSSGLHAIEEEPHSWLSAGDEDSARIVGNSEAKQPPVGWRNIPITLIIRSMSAIAWFQQLEAGKESIFAGMKALRITGIVVGAVVVAYFVVISFIPEWTIVGIHFRK